nr:PREDICTED: uncharacterized protein LOC103551792 isoform X2 [Equus przewalskii]
MSHLFPLVIRRPLCSGCSPVGNNICMHPVHSYRIQHVLEETHFLLLSCPSDEQEVGAREQEEERKNHALKLNDMGDRFKTMNPHPVKPLEEPVSFKKKEKKIFISFWKITIWLRTT